MKKVFVLSLLFITLSLPLWANEMMTVEEKVQKLKSELSLTDTQEAQIKPIIQEYKSKMEEARDQKMQRLSKILSADQLKKLEKMHQEK